MELGNKHTFLQVRSESMQTVDQGSGIFLSKRAIKALYFLMYFYESEQCSSNFYLYVCGQKFVRKQTYFDFLIFGSKT